MEEIDGSCKREGFWLEVLLRKTEDSGATGLDRGIRLEVGARLVYGTQMRILTGTGILYEAQTWLRVV